MGSERLATIVPLPAPDADYRAVVEVLQEISRGVDRASTFQAVARGLRRLTSFDWLGVAWRSGPDAPLTLHASLSGRPELLATSHELPDAPALNEWFAADVPRIVAPGRRPAAAASPDWPLPGDIAALVAIPMPLSGGGSRRGAQRTVRRGALLLGRTHGGFDPGLLPLLEPCASHVAVLFEKADWLERFRAVNAELRARVTEAATTVSDQPTLAMDPVEGPTRDLPWMAEDPRAIEALDLVQRAAPTDLSVLLDGESGTGKELLARTLHRLSGRTGPFVAVNVAALTPELVGSELFGHKSGAFTGARGDRKGLIAEAEGGTLFLDEIGDMPAAVQPVLLRFLEDGVLRPIGGNGTTAVDVRVVAASHRDLLADLVAGRFREDLYHRLAGLVIRLPPLRERPQDLQLLARMFVRQASGGRYDDLPADWWPALRGYHWPGNVRELRNAMRAVAQLSRGDEPEARFLPAALRLGFEAPAVSLADPYDGWTLAEIEREAVRRALRATDGHRGRAAERLGISARSLYDRVRRFGLDEA